MSLTLMCDGIVRPETGLRSSLLVNGDTLTYDEFVDESDPVQVAIFELEARADWWLSPDDETSTPFQPAGIGEAALKATPVGSTLADWHLEAAALLRDGWRP